MNLTDQDEQIIKDHLERGEALPPKYKLLAVTLRWTV